MKKLEVYEQDMKYVDKITAEATVIVHPFSAQVFFEQLIQSDYNPRCRYLSPLKSFLEHDTSDVIVLEEEPLIDITRDIVTRWRKKGLTQFIPTYIGYPNPSQGWQILFAALGDVSVVRVGGGTVGICLDAALEKISEQGYKTQILENLTY
ncbi:hypothetical protein FJZ18_00950 [Candidatus Pacearchaeota archaeon]|nr:hypothetical protein [Candidatus Pacearchaeota archaeon]